MPSMAKKSPHWLAAGAALLGLLSAPLTARAAAPLEAQFRGCAPEGWCRFWIETLDPFAERLHRVRPGGVSPMPGDDAKSIAMRDRLNALLASMIHQHKRIVLHDLRELNDGTFAAEVTVDGLTLASDPMLLELQGKLTSTIR